MLKKKSLNKFELFSILYITVNHLQWIEQKMLNSNRVKLQYFVELDKYRKSKIIQ